MKINVALIGYAFMGRAHSNAYRQVARFFSPKLTPVMKIGPMPTVIVVDFEPTASAETEGQ